MPTLRTGRGLAAPRPAASLLIVALLLPSAAAAQSSTTAFDTITTAVRVTANVNRNVFHEYWRPDPGVEVEFDTPFYFGNAQTGLHFNSFEGRGDEQPDFASLFAFIGWGYEWPVDKRLAWRNGIRLGTFFTRFAGSEDNRSELELATAVDTRLRFPLASNWSVELSARYQVVFTHERLRLLFLALGGSYSFRTPGWLQEFLN